MAPASLTLWLLRHAKTVADPPAGGDDIDRILAPRGRRDATALGHLLGTDGAGLGLEDVALPQVALVSPAARTMATADLVLADLATPPVRRVLPDLYGAEPEEVLDHVRALRDETSVMVLGHNPTAQALAVGLVASDDTDGHDLVVRRGFPTCALGIYRFEVDRWADVAGQTARLLGLFTPPFEER